MELERFYSLDECSDREDVFEKLNELKSNSKIEYKYLDYIDVIKIIDISLSDSDIKKLLKFFDKNDLIIYSDLDEIQDIDSEDDDYYDDYYDDENL